MALCIIYSILNYYDNRFFFIPHIGVTTQTCLSAHFAFPNDLWWTLHVTVAAFHYFVAKLYPFLYLYHLFFVLYQLRGGTGHFRLSSIVNSVALNMSEASVLRVDSVPF